MLENLLQKITPKQFFAALGGLLAIGFLSALAVVAILVATNFNILNWLE